jgi:hypothetical protein
VAKRTGGRIALDVVNALLGISAYQRAAPNSVDIDDESVREAREALGGNLQPVIQTKLRWYLEDLERAQAAADAGFPREAARLYRAMRRDGVFAGLMGTRTSGLVRLPKRFYGDKEIADELRAKNGTRSVFDEMYPPSELALLAGDGIALGIGVAERVPVPGRSYPVAVRLEPEFLTYRWNENRWYFQSIAGNLPITPGDGRWILHVPGGRLTPWISGLWPALGRAFINKEHAISYRANYISKLANAARVIYSPKGATEPFRLGMFKKIAAWAANTVIELPEGWEAKLLESNGRGEEAFEAQIRTSNEEYMIALAGQIVTTVGGTGFQNADVYKTIRQDLVQDTGDQLAYTLNTQGIPPFIAEGWGEEAILTKATMMLWDTETPADRDKESRVLKQFADAVEALDRILAAHDKGLDLDELVTRFGIPTTEQPLKLAPAPERPADHEPSPEARAAVTRLGVAA